MTFRATGYILAAALAATGLPRGSSSAAPILLNQTQVKPAMQARNRQTT